MRRLIFTLLYDRGQFMLSRNFRLQAVGSIEWLFDNYDFAAVARGLDELMVLDVSRGARVPGEFAAKVQHIASLCFIPMTVGGGIRSFDTAQCYMRSGADKLLLNSAFSADPALCRHLAAHFGRQCVVAGVDYKRTPEGRRAVMTHNGSKDENTELTDWVDRVLENGAGEVLFQSMDQDGTGMGLDLTVVDDLSSQPDVPCILMGGVGKAAQVVSGLAHPTVDAVATANLFNFIGNTFLDVRRKLVDAGIQMSQWNGDDFKSLHNRFRA